MTPRILSVISTKRTKTRSSLRNFTMSLTEPLIVASDIYHTFLRSERRQKLAVAEEWCEKFLQEDCKNAIYADTLRHVLKLHSLGGQLRNWESLEELADRGTNPSSGDLRHLRALSTIVAVWSLERVEHYDWNNAHYKMLEGLAHIARITQWDGFVPTMNCVLITRHEKALYDAKGIKIGERVRNPSHPVLQADVKSWLGLHHKPLPTQSSNRVRHWKNRSYKEIEVRGKVVAHHYLQSLPSFHVEQDQYGLLVPAPTSPRPLKRGPSCKSEIQALGTYNKKRRKSSAEDNNSTQSSQPDAPPDIPPLLASTHREESPPLPSPLTPVPSSTEESFSDTEDRSLPDPPLIATVPLSPESQDCGDGGDHLRRTCSKCEGLCRKSIISDGWSEERQRRMVEASHDAYDISLSLRDSVLDQWLKHLHFASCYTESDLATPLVTEDAADVLLLSARSLCARQTRGEVFTKPIVIRETFADAADYTLDSYGQMLRRTFCGMNIEVQQKGQSPTTPIGVDELLEGLRDGLPLNALSLDNLSKAIEPAFVRWPRYRLLRDLVVRLKARYQTNTAKQVRYYDVASCEEFNILGGRGAFSGAHVDALNGTWLRNLFGTKLWFTVLNSSMDDKAWDDFAQHGPLWDASRRARAILLLPGDVFFIPPGLLLIHAVLTIDPCGMQGGTLWDDRNISPILENLQWIGSNQLATNEPIPYQLPEIIQELESRMDEDRFFNLGDDSNFRSALRNLRDLGCVCSDNCRPNKCSCKKSHRRCTPFCREHEPTGDEEFPCMQEDHS